MPQPPLRSFIYLIFLGVSLLTLALVVRSGVFEVKTHDEPINAAMRAALAEENPELSTADSLLVEQRYPTAHVLDSGLRYVVRSPGSGDTPRPGQWITAHYTGWLLDGTMFDSSYKRGEPIAFRVGTGQVIKGWDQALLQMRKGEKRTLIIPYWLAYGEKGRPPTIPAKATLIFDVELVDLK
jgi:FKBP-type peptidyl-prolyl cis-trans isomerase